MNNFLFVLLFLSVELNFGQGQAEVFYNEDSS